MPRGDEHKFDADKPDWSLLPLAEVEQVVDVLTYGADKYTRSGWRMVPEPRERYFSALMRHLAAWRRGEQLDPETGMHHLAHAATNCLFLLWFEGPE